MVVVTSFLLYDTFAEPEDPSVINTVSDLHGFVKPAESTEPPVKPQKVVRPNPVVVVKEARLYRRLFDRLKGIITHLLYLGEFIIYRQEELVMKT